MAGMRLAGFAPGFCQKFGVKGVHCLSNSRGQTTIPKFMPTIIFLIQPNLTDWTVTDSYSFLSCYPAVHTLHTHIASEKY